MIDPSWLQEHTINLYRLARKQTFSAYHQEADYVYGLLQEEGFESQLLEFPADGKTTYQDKCSPIGWDVTTMRLTVLSGVQDYEGKAIADYETEPLSAVKHSVSTPAEGLVAKVVTEAQMKAGEDVRGAFVLLDQDTRPCQAAVRMLLDLGAYGWISDYLENPNETPDCVSWLNAGTEHNAWHVQADDRDFISFQITPRDGFALRAACQKREVKVHALSDGRRHESTIHAVTALLPGEDDREVWVVSHLYEPLIDDNSNGVIGSIQMLKALRELADQRKICLKYSVRLVFASEYYGTAAVAEYFGGDLSEKTIGAINTDGLLSSIDKSVYKELVAIPAPDFGKGHAGNILMRLVCDEFVKIFPEYHIKHEKRTTCGDDCFLGDPTIGLPVMWVYYGNRGYHHNSYQSEDKFDVKSLAEHVALCAELLRCMVAFGEEEVEAILPYAVALAKQAVTEALEVETRPGTDEAARKKFICEREISRIEGLALWGNADSIKGALRDVEFSPAEGGTCEAAQHPTEQQPTEDPGKEEYRGENRTWFGYAERFVFGRIHRGFPHDLVKRPFAQRVEMPGSILYDTISDVLCRMDGKKNLQQLLTEVEWDQGIVFDEKTIRKYLYTCIMLAESGYLSIDVKDPVTVQDMADALAQLGVKKGDTLLVHSSLSGLGYLPEGPGMVIEALKQAVGEEGTFLMPAFGQPYIMFEGEVNKSYIFRPYDTRSDGALRDKGIWTGGIPQAMLKYPGIVRSGHYTHEWVAWGKEAETCVRGHGKMDAPTGATSPLARALERNGSVVFLGCSVGSNTFIHHVETLLNHRSVAPGVMKYLDENGEPHTGFFAQQMPGYRSFYQGLDSEYYRDAVKRGLKIDKVSFGMATLYRMELRQVYDITMEMLTENPDRIL